MYLVDGHNLIGSGLVPGVSLNQEDDEERLVAYLRARQPALGQTVMIVFDRGIPGGFSNSLSGGGVTVVFARSGRTEADAIILDHVRKHTGKTPLTVVSKDRRIRSEAQAVGARVQTPDQFLARLKKPKRHPAHQRRPRPEPKLPKAEVEAWEREFRERPKDGSGF